MEQEKDLDALKRIMESLRELDVDEQLTQEIDRLLEKYEEAEEESEKDDDEEPDQVLTDKDEDNEDEDDRIRETDYETRPRKHRREPAHEAIDLSVLSAPSLPCTWPSSFLPPLVLMHYLQHGPGPYASEALVIDEHTGTHWDAPAHFIPPPSTGLPNAADIGNVPSERVPIWQFVGEACVIRLQGLANGPNPAQSGR